MTISGRVKRIDMPIEELVKLIIMMGSIFLFGISVGKVLGERSAKGVFKPFADEYRKQKGEMWKKIKKMVRT